MKHRFILLFLVVTNILFAQDQKRVDSLLNIIETTKIDTTKASAFLNLGKLYRYNEPEKFLSYLKEALEIFQEEKDYRKQGVVYSNMTAYYNIKGIPDSAQYFVNKSIKYYTLGKDTLGATVQKINVAYFNFNSGKREQAIQLLDSIEPIFLKHKDSVSIANVYTIKYFYFVAKGYNNIALELAQKALKIYRKTDDQARVAQSLTLIGNIYQKEASYIKAIESYEECLEISKKNDNRILEAQTLKLIGECYRVLKKFDKAQNYLTMSQKISKELNFKFNTANVTLLLGELQFAQKKYDKAISHYNEALAISKGINNIDQLAVTHRSFGKVYNHKKEYKVALNHLNKTIKITKNSGSSGILSDAYKEKSFALQNLGDYKGAFFAIEEYRKLNDSIFTFMNKQKTEELNIIYETEKREQQIAKQETEISLLEEQKKVSNLQRILLALCLALAVIAAYAFYQRNKSNKLAKEKAEIDLEFKTKELTTHALHLAKKNEVLNDLKQKAKVFKADANADPGYQMLIQTINFDLQDDNNWENFSNYFQEVYKDFNSNAQQKFPAITTNDLRLMALLKMNLSSKEIANILNISNDGIKKARQRLRKKMGIDSDQSLEAIIIAI